MVIADCKLGGDIHYLRDSLYSLKNPDFARKGEWMIKLGFSDSNRVKRYFWLSEDCTELNWGSSSDDPRYLRVRLAEAIGLSFGPLTTTFSRISMSEERPLSWCCFSLIFVGRTLDLCTMHDNAHLWFLAIQKCIMASGGFLVSKLCYSEVIKRKVQMKVRYRADSLGRTLAEHIQLTAQQVYMDLYGKSTMKMRVPGSFRKEIISLKGSLAALRNCVHSFALESLDIFDKLKKELMNPRSATSCTPTKELEILRMERRKLHNDLMELKGNIRVFARVRPLLAPEVDDSDEQTVLFKDDRISIYNSLDARRRVYDFDQVFGPCASQEDIFRHVDPFITSFMDGFNVSLFAYGVTNSGKTYTMEGTPSAPGVTRRTLNKIISAQLNVKISALQIYNETAYDLLNQAQPVNIRVEGSGFAVPGLKELPVTDANQAEEIISCASRLRYTNITKLNDFSSRSHFLVIVSLRQATKPFHTISKLNLVDLAGSENVNRSGAAGTVLREAQAINRSLSALGDVISALVNKKHKHIPFRNSKLTMLLKDSLEGNGKALMIVQASPRQDDVSETLGSLQFGSRVRMVELGKATRNVELTESTSNRPR